MTPNEIEGLQLRYTLACNGRREAEARNKQLEALLRELLDIEGPQPGHVMWYRKVCDALGIPSDASDEHGSGA